MISEILGQLGITCEYGVFKKGLIPLPPYAIWYIERELFEGSDDIWMYKTSYFVIELYTDKKDFELEKQLENALPASDIEKTEEYYHGDEVYCVTYKYKTINKRRF